MSEWQATYFVLRSPRGLGQVYEGANGKWCATAAIWLELPLYESRNLGTFASIEDAQAACERVLSGDATCGPANVDGDGREVAA